MPFSKTIQQNILINAPASKVWDALTNPEEMKRWYSDSEINIQSDWKVNGLFILSGNWHGTEYMNKGTILKLEPKKNFRYTHLSSMSEIKDIPENYTVLDFSLEEKGVQTLLTLNCSNLIDEAIYGHMQFYWNVTLLLLKQQLEEN